MFQKSREKLKRRQKPFQRPRAYDLKKRFNDGNMTYETKMRLLRLERKLTIVHIYRHEDFFPENPVYTWVFNAINFCINAAFVLWFIWLAFIALVSMGPSYIESEAFVYPLSYTLEYALYQGANFDEFSRFALKHNLFVLG